MALAGTGHHAIHRPGRAAAFPAVLAIFGALSTLPVLADTIPDVPDDIFGFTSTTGVGDRGGLGFASEFDGAVGKRSGRYAAFFNKSELGYTFADNWWIAGSVFASHHRIRDVPDLPDTGSTRFNGVSVELMHRFVERSASNPLALTVAIERYWTPLDGGNGQRANAYGAAFKLFADAVLVPDKLFWGANAVYAPQRGQDSADRSTWLSSSVNVLSTGLTVQLAPALFAGIEARYLTAYDGTWFDNRLGYAAYLGPTLLWKVTDKLTLNATWQPQISGRSVDNADLRYDLDNFERAQFRAKLSLALN
jgi:hypothetical protein